MLFYYEKRTDDNAKGIIYLEDILVEDYYWQENPFFNLGFIIKYSNQSLLR
jgi:hypothetical protein